jgi:hypothetical protein
MSRPDRAHVPRQADDPPFVHADQGRVPAARRVSERHGFQVRHHPDQYDIQACQVRVSTWPHHPAALDVPTGADDEQFAHNRCSPARPTGTRIVSGAT